MKKKSFFLFLSFSISICFYLCLLFFVFLHIGSMEQKSKRYTSQKDSFIEISIKENSPKKAKNEKKLKKNSHKKKKKIKKVKKKKAQINKSMKKSVSTKSLKSLFSSINTKKLKKDINQTKKANQNSRFRKVVKKEIQVSEGKMTKKVSATKLVNDLTFELESSSAYKKSGEYNEYIGKVSDMLDQMWQETPGTMPGNSAKVTVMIDKFGNFSYKIDSLSYNNDFNTKLKTFLDGLKEKKFPPYKDGEIITLQVNFKDE